MEKEKFKEELLEDFKLQAFNNITSSLDSENVDLALKHLIEFKSSYGEAFISTIVDNLYSVYKDLSLVNKKLILHFLYELWNEHRILYIALTELEELTKNISKDNEIKSLRARIEAVKTTTEIIKQKEAFKHKFLSYIEKLISILIPNKNSSPPPPTIFIKFENPGNIEVVKTDLE